MTIFVVYLNPRDYPGRFVVRRWRGLFADIVPTAVVDTLEQARAAVPRGLTCVAPHCDDDPVIVETWL